MCKKSLKARQINPRIAGVIYAPNQMSSFYKFNRGVGCVRIVNLLLCIDKKKLKTVLKLNKECQVNAK